MKYKIEITETLQKVVEVEADDIQKAMSIVKEMYHNEEIILDDKGYIDTKIEVVG